LSNDLYDRIEAELAKPEPEPVAWMYDWKDGLNCLPVKNNVTTLMHKITHFCAHNVRPLYTSPPARKPLSDDEIDSIKFYSIPSDFDAALRRFARSIEKAHGISNE
jgi:hypothetical protein